MGVERFVSQEVFLAHRLLLCSTLLCSGACGWTVIRSVGLFMLSMIHIWEVFRGMQCWVGLWCRHRKEVSCTWVDDGACKVQLFDVFSRDLRSTFRTA